MWLCLSLKDTGAFKCRLRNSKMCTIIKLLTKKDKDIKSAFGLISLVLSTYINMNKKMNSHFALEIVDKTELL